MAMCEIGIPLTAFHAGLLGPDGTMLSIIPSAAVGLYAGTYVDRKLKERKLLKQSREMGGWIRDARISAGIGGLEKKAEEDVGLTADENDKIARKGLKPLGSGILISLGASIPLALNQDLYAMGAYAGGVLTMLSTIPYVLYAKNRALKQKMLAAGLEGKVEGPSRNIFGKIYDATIGYPKLWRESKPEMQEIGRYIINIEQKETSIFPTFMNTHLRNFLEESGLKKRFLRRKFVGDGIEIIYKEIIGGHRIYKFTTHAQVTIKATDERKKEVESIRRELERLEISDEGPG